MSGGSPGASTLFPFGQDFQNHQPHWGTYAVYNDLPNRPGNVLIAGKWENLRVGQIARVAADSGLYICDSTGVAGGGNAVWLLIGPSGAAGTDHFAPRYLVGNTLAPYLDPAVPQVAPFVYIPDPGDGTGIEAALAAAAIIPGDVWIRPGTYDLSLGPVVTPMVVPPNVRVYGSGYTTRILGRLTGNQGVFVLGTDASLHDMTILVSASDAGSVVSVAVVRALDAGNVRRVNITFVTALGGALNDGILIEGSRATVEGCKVGGSSADGDVRGIAMIGLRHDVHGNTFVASSVTGAVVVGIECSASRSRVRGNEAESKLPISLPGADNVVFGNICEGATGDAIVISGLGNEVAHNVGA